MLIEIEVEAVVELERLRNLAAPDMNHARLKAASAIALRIETRGLQ